MESSNRKYQFYCSVLECLNSTTNSTKSLFRLPPDPQRRYDWLTLIQREDLLNTSCARVRVCEDHFDPSFIKRNAKRALLSKNAVPELALPPAFRFNKETQTEIIFNANMQCYYTVQTIVTSNNLVNNQATLQNQVQSTSGTNNSNCNTKSPPSTSKRTAELQCDEDIIANVYNYLQTEYEELKSSIGDSCDLSPLANILKRTASATGVSEDTVSAILENKKRAADYECDADVKRVKLTHDYEDGDVSQTTLEESSCEESDEEQDDQNEPTYDVSQQLPIEFEVETVKVEPVYEDEPLDPLQLQMSETECDVQHQRSSNVGDVPSVSNTTHTEITTQPAVVVYPQSSDGVDVHMSIEPITSLATLKTEPDGEHTHSSVTCTGDVECDTTLCDVKCEPPDS